MSRFAEFSQPDREDREKAINDAAAVKRNPALLNKYAGRCVDCGRDIPAGMGSVRPKYSWADAKSAVKGRAKWVTTCSGGECKDIPGLHDKGV